MNMWDILMLLGIREKIIRKLNYDEEENDYLYNIFIEKRATKKSDVLRSIALFDKIECIEATFDLTNLINEGVIENDHSVIDLFEEIQPNNRIPEDSDKKEMLELINSQTAEILIRSKKQIINHLRNINHVFATVEEYDENSSYYFDESMKYYTDFESYEIDNAEEWFEDQLDNLYRTVFVGIYKSLKQECIYSPSFNFRSNLQIINPNELLDDVYYTVQTKLKEEIIYLPQPSTLREALQFRNQPEIKRFREVLSYWLESIKSGDNQLEEIIRKDIKKANLELRRINNIRKFNNSQINFWLNSIGGHIPIFSNILTATNMFAGLYEKFASKQNNWIMMIKP